MMGPQHQDPGEGDCEHKQVEDYVDQIVTDQVEQPSAEELRVARLGRSKRSMLSEADRFSPLIQTQQCGRGGHVHERNIIVCSLLIPATRTPG